MLTAKTTVISLGLFLVAALTSGAAFAEGPRAGARRTDRATQNGSYSYEFLDDPLSAGGFDPHGAVLKLPTRRLRLLLIRPRTQFVSEMLKSVESL